MLESSINKEWNEKRLLQMESAEGFVEEEQVSLISGEAAVPSRELSPEDMKEHYQGKC